jgi:hypothetical protein
MARSRYKLRQAGWPAPSGFRRAMVLMALGLWLAPARAGAATFTASLDRDTVTLGENATLSLTFQGGSPQQVPEVPSVPNLRISYGGPLQQISWINGETSITVTHNFSVTPMQAGEFTIPAITAVVGQARLTSQPLKLKVLKPGAPPPEAIASGSQVAFLKLVVPKQELYVGESIVGELDLCVREGVRHSDPGGLGFPAESFNLGQLLRMEERRVQVGSAVYRVCPFAFTLKPVKTGKLALGPVTARVVVQVPSANARRDPFFGRDPFPDFPFGGFFGNVEQKEIGLATGAVDVDVLPLPTEGRPADFNGAVGNYTLAVSVGPTNVVAGDPVTVRVQLSGRGAVDALTLPDRPEWPDFKIYPPTAKPVETADRFGLQGTKTFEQIVVPQSAAVKEVPAISFSYFDPAAKSYRTLTQPAVPLVVRPGGAPAAPSVAAASRVAPDAQTPAQDIVHIKPRLGAVAPSEAAWAGRLWLDSVPVAAWLCAWVWRRRADALANNPRLRRRRHVAHVVRRGRVELRQLAAAKKSDEFFAVLFRLLQEQLGERLALPASSITEAVVEQNLRPRGAPESVLSKVQELFHVCNLARYAPSKSSQELVAIIPRFEATLRELQALEL